MGRSKADIFKEYGKNEIFVIGETPEERAKILYIRSGLKPKQIKARLKRWGDPDLPLDTIKNWIQSGKWAQLRKQYILAYDAKAAEVQAEKQAVADVNDQEQVRHAYARAAAEISAMIKQKFDFNRPKYGEAAVVKSVEIMQLSVALKNLSEVHFRSLGIPETVVVDPTAGNDSIRVMTKQDLDRLANKDND